MQIKSGTDIVSIERFEEAIARTGTKFLEQIFNESELNISKHETLAGMFAAKEAVRKALDDYPFQWHDLLIQKKHNGKPEVSFIIPIKQIISQDISISHDGGLAIAIAIFLIN
ncbi:MAG: holo-ACP synthase [bacterium]